MILVWKFSRFARNQDESVFYKSILRKKCGIDVVSITEPIMEGMYGRLIETIIEWNDEFYSYNLSQEVIRGMDEKDLRGGYQSTPCLGYAAVGHGNPHVIVEDEYKIYQYICDQFDFQHVDPTAIARKCNEMGFRTKRGNLFQARTVKNILRNPFYVGTVIWNGHEFIGTHETRMPRERYEERIRRMDSMYQPKQRRNISGCRHWLSGIVKCPYCGASLGFNNSSRPRTPPFFSCWKYGKGYHRESVSITEKKLVRAVVQNFEDILSGQNFEFQYIPSKQDDRTEIDLLKAELGKLDGRERRIRLAFETEIDTLEEYRENKLRLAAERERLLSELAEKENGAGKLPDRNAVLSRIQTVYDVIQDPDVDYTLKGDLMRSIVKEIIYDKENSKLIFHFYSSETA